MVVNIRYSFFVRQVPGIVRDLIFQRHQLPLVDIEKELMTIDCLVKLLSCCGGFCEICLLVLAM